MSAKLRSDLIVAPVCEAALLAIVGCAGWLSHQPMIFTSLGPTAYEIVETPDRRSAKPYSVIVGHLAGVVSGYLSLLVTGAWWALPVSSHGVVPQRIGAACLAAALTVLLTLLLHASQPAALSTTLLIALGSMQQPKDALVIMAAVLLMALIGEPLRALRLRRKIERDSLQEKIP